MSSTCCMSFVCDNSENWSLDPPKTQTTWASLRNSHHCLKLLGMLVKCQKVLLLRFVTQWDERDVQGNRIRIFPIWHIPTDAIGSYIIFVRLQNTTSQEASQGAKTKQGIVAQSLSGWQSTVFCILYEYMQIYVWDVNKVHLSTIAEAWVGFTCHYD